MQKSNPNTLAAQLFRVVFSGAALFILAIIIFVL